MILQPIDPVLIYGHYTAVLCPWCRSPSLSSTICDKGIRSSILKLESLVVFRYSSLLIDALSLNILNESLLRLAESLCVWNELLLLLRLLRSAGPKESIVLKDVVSVILDRIEALSFSIKLWPLEYRLLWECDRVDPVAESFLNTEESAYWPPTKDSMVFLKNDLECAEKVIGLNYFDCNGFASKKQMKQIQTCSQLSFLCTSNIALL